MKWFVIPLAIFDLTMGIYWNNTVMGLLGIVLLALIVWRDSMMP